LGGEDDEGAPGEVVEAGGDEGERHPQGVGERHGEMIRERRRRGAMSPLGSSWRGGGMSDSLCWFIETE
jgi:hypothetical protein